MASKSAFPHWYALRAPDCLFLPPWRCTTNLRLSEEGNANATDTDAAVSAITMECSVCFHWSWQRSTINQARAAASSSFARHHSRNEANPGLLEIVEAVSRTFTESTSFSQKRQMPCVTKNFVLKSAGLA
jgi:hypothetical protein